MRSNSWAEWEDRVLINNYPSLTVNEILPKLDNRTKRATHKRLQILGIQVEQWASKYSANNDFFAVPNNLNCYWAGFIAADGCVVESKNCKTKTLKIEITDSDREHLKKFADDVEFNGEIKSGIVKRGEINGRILKSRNTASINISCSQKWFEDLESNFNREFKICFQ